MELKDLILLNEVEAKIAIIKALRQELKIYIVDIAKNMPQLLSVGVLEEIRQAIPEQIVITLEAPSPGATIGRYAKVSYLDFRITQSEYNEIFNNNPKQSIGEKDINETERNTLYKMILVMAMEKYQYDPQKNRNLATGSNKGSIKADLERYGLSLDDETIRFHLGEAFSMHEGEILITE